MNALSVNDGRISMCFDKCWRVSDEESEENRRKLLLWHHDSPGHMAARWHNFTGKTLFYSQAG